GPADRGRPRPERPEDHRPPAPADRRRLARGRSTAAAGPRRAGVGRLTPRPPARSAAEPAAARAAARLSPIPARTVAGARAVEPLPRPASCADARREALPAGAGPCIGPLEIGAGAAAGGRPPETRKNT